MNRDVEILLDRKARAALPLSRQILLYLDPFSLFKDATRGPAWQQEMALRYNQAMRWVLIPYLRRWLAIAGGLFLCIAPAEALAAKNSIFIVPAAAFGVGCSIAVTVVFCTLAAYLLLSRRR